MALFDFLKKKKEETKSEEELILEGHESNETVIPDHVKSKDKEKKSDVKEMFTEKKTVKNQFRVTKVYDMGIQIMISGFVVSGKIKKKMKTKVNKLDLVVDDLKIGFDNVQELLANEEGTIFVKTKQFPLIRLDDVLEFK